MMEIGLPVPLPVPCPFHHMPTPLSPPPLPPSPCPDILPEPLKTNLNHVPQTPMDPQEAAQHLFSLPPRSSHIPVFPTSPLPPCQLLWGLRSRTFRGRQDDLAEGPAAQLVLS